MSVSTRVRFEVLKRDEFRCAYCGRVASDKELHVDHIVPRSKGGSDDITNLITACRDCNLGKSDKPLADSQAPTVTERTVAGLESKVDRTVRYARAVAAERQLLEEQAVVVRASWGRLFGAEERDGYLHLDYGQEFPEARSLVKILAKLPLERVLMLADECARKFDRADEGARRYFFGMCWRTIKSGDLEYRLAVAHEEILDLQLERASLIARLEEAEDRVLRLEAHVCQRDEPKPFRYDIPEHIGAILGRGVAP